MKRFLFFTLWDVLVSRTHHLVRESRLMGNIADVVTFTPLKHLKRIRRGSPFDSWASKVIRIPDPLPRQIYYRYAFARRLTDRLRRRLLVRFAGAALDRYDFVVITHPAFEFILEYPLPPLIYDCMEDWGEFTGYKDLTAEIARFESQAGDLARVIWATSPGLQGKFSRFHPGKVHFLPNGSDFAFFQDYRSQRGVRARRPQDRPVATYVGTISDWLDLDLLGDLASRLREFDFHLYGPVSYLVKDRFVRFLRQWDNVVHQGAVSYQEVPRVLDQADVCLIPFKCNALVAAVSPIKLYEYLAMGKPVVSSPMADVLRYAGEGVVYSCTTPKEWQEAITEGLRLADDPGFITKRFQAAASNTWQARWLEGYKTLGGERGK